MRAKGLDASDNVISQAVSLRIVQTLRIRAKRRKGIDGSLRRRGVCVWRLTSEGGAASTLSTGAKPDVARLTVLSEQTACRSTRVDGFRAIPFQPHTRRDTPS